MSRELRAAAVYRPVYEVGGHRRAGPDEDGFTLAVAAGELVLPPPTVPAPEFARIHYFGPPQAPEAAPNLPVALGLPRAVADRADPTAETFREMLQTELAGADEGGAALLIAVDTGPYRPLPDGSGAGDGAAVALWIDRADSVGELRTTGVDPFPEGLAQLGGAGSAVRAAIGLRRTEAAAPWVGASAAPRPLPEAPWAAETADRLDLRSEGAYVPRATYVENLPSRWRFAADRCSACGALTFPIRGYCRSCGGADGLLREELSRRGGIVEAVTTIHPGAQPTEFDGMVTFMGAYDVVLVGLAPGGRVTLQGTERPPGGFRVGAKVDTVLRRLYPMEGEWRYGRKAVPTRG